MFFVSSIFFYNFALTNLLVKMDKHNCKQKDTETLILEAATKEFGAKGFDGARTSTIAAEAGVTHAMLHYYFRTKKKLFERIFQDKINQIINVILSSMIESKEDIKTRIRKMIERHIDFLNDNKELPTYFINTINTQPQSYIEAITRLLGEIHERLDNFQEILDAAHKKGEINKVDARTLVGDIACLNVFPFVAYPIMMTTMGYDDFDTFITDRKKENIEIILKRIS